MPFRDFSLTYQSHLSAAMAANSQNYGSLPEIVPTSAPKTSKRRAIASVAVAVMMFAAGAAALNSKTTVAAPTALAAYDAHSHSLEPAIVARRGGRLLTT